MRKLPITLLPNYLLIIDHVMGDATPEFDVNTNYFSLLNDFKD